LAFAEKVVEMLFGHAVDSSHVMLGLVPEVFDSVNLVGGLQRAWLGVIDSDSA
jgi:hypothetical protein